MKNLLIMAFAFSTLTVIAADASQQRHVRPRGPARPSGGIVEKAYDGKVLRVLNAQAAISDSKLAELTQHIRWTSLIPIEVIAGTLTNDSHLVAANALVSQANVGAGVLLVESDSLPIILSSPDARWAILNVAALKVDNPTQGRLEDRFTKVYWCAVARSLGVGNSCYPGCVLVPFTDIKGLDRIGVLQPCPEPFNKMIDSAAVIGIKTLSIASYRTACQQGWAPAPTNDIQKAIWDMVHAVPATPMKIEFDPKKGR